MLKLCIVVQILATSQLTAEGLLSAESFLWEQSKQSKQTTRLAVSWLRVFCGSELREECEQNSNKRFWCGLYPRKRCRAR
jgi:hypothetical protein